MATCGIYQVANHTRSRVVCEAAQAGLKAAGYGAPRVPQQHYSGPVFDFALFYGLVGNTPKLFREYPRAGKPALYADLGYFGRKVGGRWSGFHKICRNSRHPTDYYRRVKHPPDRFNRLNETILPWRKGGRNVVVCGTSDKGAIAEGFRPGQWEAETIAELKKHTDRPIVYRPKPSWDGRFPIPGAEYRMTPGLLCEELRHAHAVVCHHSNAAVEAIVQGVPAFCWHGVAKEMSLQDLAKIETPHFPEDREQWCWDLAYTQWSIAELATAEPWLHMKSEGLIP